MLRKVEYSDLEQLRKIRNKWRQLDIFRQNHDILEQEQIDWFESTDNAGLIINDRAYGKIYSDGEISFYGYDEWLLEDLQELINYGKSKSPILFGECYQFNPFLYLWLQSGFTVEGVLRNRRYHNGRVWDSLLLELE